MGRLVLPVGGEVYVDAQVPIYTADVHPTYAPVLRPLWDAGVAGTLQIVSSELTLMETLVGPLRSGKMGFSYGITAADTISRTRRRPSSPPMLPSLKGVRGMGFQLSRDVSTWKFCGRPVKVGSYWPLLPPSL